MMDDMVILFGPKNAPGHGDEAKKDFNNAFDQIVFRCPIRGYYVTNFTSPHTLKANLVLYDLFIQYNAPVGFE